MWLENDMLQGQVRAVAYGLPAYRGPSSSLTGPLLSDSSLTERAVALCCQSQPPRGGGNRGVSTRLRVSITSERLTIGKDRTNRQNKWKNTGVIGVKENLKNGLSAGVKATRCCP